MTTRARRKCGPSVESNAIVSKRVENSWILVIKESVLENSNFTFITLSHPGHGEATKYCIDEAHNKLFEIVTFNEPYRSWFIGDTVKSDSSILLVTPVNPLFLVLPKLREQCCNRAVPLEDLLSEKGFDKIIDVIPNLDCIADLKGPPDMKAYKYNEEKTLAWLEQRVRSVAKILQQKNIHVTSGAVSATFVTSNIDNNYIDEEFYLKYAHGLISEYLQDDLVESLVKRFNFKPELIEALGKKRKSEIMEQNENKRAKCEPENGIKAENYIACDAKKQKPLTAKEKARMKAASGTKTLSAFFAKK